MGSIQALRSEAIAMRSKEDTEVEVSAYLGTVNKSLGNQITTMVDQLQSTILERTKAYNLGIANMKKSLEGKNGVCDQMVLGAFKAVNDLIALFSSFTFSGWGIIQTLISLVGAFLAGSSSKKSLEMKILADTYNYEKAISQLGFTKMDPSYITSAGKDPITGRSIAVPLSDAGATSLLNKRDALCPRYKPRDKSWGVNPKTNGIFGAYPTPTPVPNPSPIGYVGTLRRV